MGPDPGIDFSVREPRYKYQDDNSFIWQMLLGGWLAFIFFVVLGKLL